MIFESLNKLNNPRKFNQNIQDKLYYPAKHLIPLINDFNDPFEFAHILTFEAKMMILNLVWKTRGYCQQL